MSPILGIYASQISGHLFAPSGAYDSIATTTVGSGGTASVTFSSIPTTYTHLQIRIFARTNRASTRDGVKLRFNGDSTSSYAQHNLYGDGSSAVATGYPNEPEAALDAVTAATGTANSFGTIIVDILNFSSTAKTTTVRSFGGLDNNGNGKINLTSNLWNKTDAVTSIYLAPYSGTLFNEYSSFALYGIKGN